MKFNDKIKFSESNVEPQIIPPCEYGDDDKNQLQYFALYKHRLKLLKPRLISAAERKFPEYEFKNLYQMAIDEEAIVCGIFVKKIKLQPEILDEYLEDVKKETPPNKLTDEDELGFEDETQRTTIAGITNVKIKEIVTGQCAAVLGKINQTGQFELLDWTCADPATKDRSAKTEPTVVGFAGDFRFGSEDAPSFLALELLSNFITSAIGERAEQTGKVSRLALVGLINTGTQYERQKNGRIDTKNVTACYKIADEYFSEISRFLPIDIFTGSGDAGSLTIPSVGLHKLIFKKTQQGEMKCYPTPVAYTVNGTHILHISDLIIGKMKEYSALSTELEIMQRLLELSHMAPISPDVIPAVPYQTTDPFVISQLPDVVWCIGDEFDSSTISIGEEKVLLFVVPRFATTSSIVLMKTKENDDDMPSVQLVQFSLPEF